MTNKNKIFVLLISLLPGALAVQAYERNGLAINEQCDLSARSPGQPYNSQDGKAANGCFLCHDGGETGLGGAGRMAFAQGNLDFFCTLNLTNKAPEIAFIGPQSVNVGQPLQFQLNAKDGDGDELHFHEDNLPEGAKIQDNGNGTAIFSWTPDSRQAGTTKIYFIVSDSGSPTAVDSEQVVINVNDSNNPPLLTPLGNQAVEENKELQIEVSASDTDRDALRLSHSELPAGATFNDRGDGTGVLTWVPGSGSSGFYPVTFTVSDQRKKDSETIVIVVKPSGTFITPESAIESLSKSQTTAPTDSASAQPRGQLGARESLPFVLPDPNNANGKSVTTETLTAAPGENRPPILEVVEKVSVVAGKSVEVSVKASDPDGDKLTLRLFGQPINAKFMQQSQGKALFLWQTTEEDIGVHPLMFSVTDDGTPQEIDDRMVFVNVVNASDAASITDAVDSNVQIISAEWRPRLFGRSMLLVRGLIDIDKIDSDTRRVMLFSADSGENLGSARIKEDGSWLFRTNIIESPCAVTAEYNNQVAHLYVDNSNDSCAERSQ